MKRRMSRGMNQRAPSRRVLDIMEELDDDDRRHHRFQMSRTGTLSSVGEDSVQSSLSGGEGRINHANATRARQSRPLMLHNAYGARGNNLTKRESTRNITMKHEMKRKTNLMVERTRRESLANMAGSVDGLSGGRSGGRSSTENLSINERELRLLKQLDADDGLKKQGLQISSLHVRKSMVSTGASTITSAGGGAGGGGSPFDDNAVMYEDPMMSERRKSSAISGMDYSGASSYGDQNRRISQSGGGGRGRGGRNSVFKRVSLMLGGGSKQKLDMSESSHTQQGKVEGRDIFEGYDDKLKKANSICRWNWLWLIWCFICPYPLWLTFVDCQMAYEITIIVNLIMMLNFIYTTILAWRYMWKMIRSFNTPFWQELDPETRDKVQHVVVLPTYKEPVQVLLETISSIANQTIAARLIVVVGFEEKTPNKEEKKRQIIKQFGDSVLALVFSVHPFGTPGEIQGACSNRNYAARFAVKYMLKEGLLPIDPETLEVDLDFTTVTVCDADTTFFYRYFENLTYCFLMEPPKSRYEVCWQSPLFYNIALDQRWFFTRVMGILRSYFMVGFLIGWDINTMSIYSQSLKLLIDSRYFHPGYQMDDIIYTLSAMKSTHKRIRIRTIDIPTLSGPTSGVNFCDEFREWAVQAARWTIGAAEVFHYFTVKMIRGNFFLAGLEYFCWFVYYYIFILSGSVLINLSAFIIEVVGAFHEPVSITTCKPFVGLLGEDFPYQWILSFFFVYTYVTVGGTAFFMDALVSQILALKEEIHPLRNFVHWLMMMPVWWMYGLVKFKSICKIAIEGKKACGHVASEKHALVAGGAAAAPAIAEGEDEDGSSKKNNNNGGLDMSSSMNSTSHKSGGSTAFNIHNRGGGKSKSDDDSAGSADSFARERSAAFNVDNNRKNTNIMTNNLKMSSHNDESSSSINDSERDDFFPTSSKTGYMPTPNAESALGFDRSLSDTHSSGGSSNRNPPKRIDTNEEVKRDREQRPTTVMEMGSAEESSRVSSSVDDDDRHDGGGSDDDHDDPIPRLSLARLPTKDSWASRENSATKLASASSEDDHSKSSTSSVYNQEYPSSPSGKKSGTPTNLTPTTNKNSNRELWQDEGRGDQGGMIWQEEKKEANENLLGQVPAFFGKIRIALKAEITSMPDGDEYYFV